MICRFPRLAAGSALLLAAIMLRAQEAGPKLLTTIEEVLAYDTRAAEARPRQVRVKGVVVAVSSLFTYFHMHDGRRGIAVRYPRKLAPPKQGDQIEVSGETAVNSHEGQQIMRILAADWTVSGAGDLPPAEPVEREHLRAASAMDQWLSCDARISDWRLNAQDMLLRLVLRDGAFDAFVELPASAAPPPRLFGARVRLTGVVTFTPALGRVLFVPDMKQFKLVEPGTDDPFDTPLVSIPEFRQRLATAPWNTRVRGVVLGVLPGDLLHVREGDAALRIQLRQPLSRADKPDPAAAAGDEIEVAGFRLEAHDGSNGKEVDLAESQWRLIGKSQPPQPVVSALAGIAAGEHTADLVETRGRLLTVQQVPLERGEWRTSLLVEADGVQLPAALRTRGRASLDTVKTDDDVLLRGLVVAATAADPRQIRLLDPDGIKSLGVSAVVRTRQLWLWSGGTLAVVALFSGWIIALRKSNRVKTEVAFLLEQRVAERTAELSKAQADLSLALEHERELGELKSRFVTTVSHEFRTPLGIIMSAIELMRHYDEKLPPEQRGVLQNDIFSATRHMAGLMEQVLVLGRVEAGKLGCKTAPCDLDILASKIVDENLSATNRRCPVSWRAEGDLSGAHADEALLRHIFSNLITNAVKYSPAGSEVLFTVRRDGSDAVFQVIDHGIGIPEGDRARLFEAFHRCSNVGETPGTGLGLVIVKRCVDLHGGSLHIDSAFGKGTTFTVRLPLFNG